MAYGKTLAVDTETTGLNVRTGDDYATGVSISFRADDGTIISHYFPFNHPDGWIGKDYYPSGNYDEEDLAMLKALIESAPLIAFHNAKFDLSALETIGINYKGKWVDTAVLAYLVNENYPASKALDTLSRYYISKDIHKEKSHVLDAFIKAFGWAKVPGTLMRKYATQDAYITFLLAEILYQKVAELGLVDYWFNQKMPLMEVVRQMEKRGIRVNQPFCRDMVEIANESMEDYKEMLGGFNPASPKQMNELFCERMGLPPIMKEKKFSKGQRLPPGSPKEYTQTFDKAAMKEYESLLDRIYKEHKEAQTSQVYINGKPRDVDFDLVDWVLAYRGWNKAGSAFYGAYLKHMDSDGRVRPHYKHHKDEDDGGTLTGRLACAEPNLQQIPKATDKPWNGRVKEAFIPSPGYELWEVDYAQLELRLGTAYANVKSLKEVFDKGEDIFDNMAADLGLVRQDTKTLVYSMQYGAGINRLMNALGLTEARAKEIRDNYFEAYPGFARISNEAKKKTLSQRRVKLWSGRWRNFAKPKEEAHKALNSIIQGGAADIVECAMIAVFHGVDQKSDGEVRMLLQVHDSVVFEIKKGTAEKWIPKIEYLMANVDAFRPQGFGVTFAVDAKPLHANYQKDS